MQKHVRYMKQDAASDQSNRDKMTSGVGSVYLRYNAQILTMRKIEFQRMLYDVQEDEWIE